MARLVSYTQCTLERGSRFRVAWIPTIFAIPGILLRLREEGGWRVAERHQTDFAIDVENRQMDYRKQRRASDI